MPIVVGAAILADHEGVLRVLAGQRSAPPELAGRWEFPGGKVEAGETDAQALVRECREELGVSIVVGSRIGPDLTIPGVSHRVLRVYEARLLDGTPQALDHAQLRWLAADELASVHWLGTNRPLLPALAARLRISSSLPPCDNENGR